MLEKNEQQPGSYSQEEINEAGKLWNDSVDNTEGLFDIFTSDDDSPRVLYNKISDLNKDIEEATRLRDAHKENYGKSDKEFAFEEVGLRPLQKGESNTIRPSLDELSEKHKESREKLEDLYMSDEIDLRRYQKVRGMLTSEVLRIGAILKKGSEKE